MSHRAYPTLQYFQAASVRKAHQVPDSCHTRRADDGMHSVQRRADYRTPELRWIIPAGTMRPHVYLVGYRMDARRYWVAQIDSGL